MKIEQAKISVVVGTYNRAQILRECINSLLNQSVNSQDYEVIIVDNNSSDETEEMIFPYTKKYNNVFYFKEINQGSSSSRNTGIQKAHTPWIAFIDDDVRVGQDYIKRILYVINNCHFDCFGGVYIPWYEGNKPYWFKDEYVSNGRKTQKLEVLDEKKYVDLGNMVARKECLMAAGCFSETIGIFGERRGYGEETLIQKKMRHLGYTIGFDPELIVEHLVPSYKFNPRWFLYSSYINGRDSWKAFGMRPNFFRILCSLFYGIILLLFKLPVVLVKLLSRDFHYQNFLIELLKLPAYSLGKVLQGIRTLGARQ